MKNFPTTLYVIASRDFKDFWVETNLKSVAENEEDGTEVAVYTLVKIGSVVEKVIERKAKVVFE